MHPIQMVDTRRQYLKIKEQIDAAVHTVIDSSVFIGGTAVGGFAENLAIYNGSRFVIPCANGTDALQIAMMALGLEPGDEVITPSFTYIATVEVIALLKLTPVFVEVDPKTFCLDPAAIEKKITPKTKAIIPVHLYGHAAQMEQIMAISEKYNIPVIEDNAQAIGCEYTYSDGTIRKTGSIGTIGCTSFYPSKNLGCFGDGGAIFTNDEALAAKLKMIANHGQSKQYYHDIVGCNSRLDAIQAAVLNVKLQQLDNYNHTRRKVADFYDQAFAALPALTTPFRADYSRHVFHQYTLILQKGNRDDLKTHLSAHSIPAMIYYPVPSHKQKMFDQIQVNSYPLPITDWLCDRVISLPIHTEMDDEQLTYITNTLIDFFN